MQQAALELLQGRILASPPCSQVADFLGADTERASAAFCMALLRHNHSAPAAWHLLEQQNAHIRDLVLSHHGVLAGDQSLADPAAQMAGLARSAAPL
jgi:hypothetical protein